MSKLAGRLLNAALVVVIFLSLAVASGRAYEVELVRQDSARTRAIICRVFRHECAKAIRVAICESHLNVRAVGGGGRYWGLFQQGAYSRARYGFGWTALAQAKAAKRHRDAEGWRPWPVCGRR